MAQMFFSWCFIKPMLSQTPRKIACGSVAKPSKALAVISQSVSGANAAAYVSYALSDECLIASHRLDIQGLLSAWSARGNNPTSELSHDWNVFQDQTLHQSTMACV